MLVPDGVGVRNFVLGRFLEELVERAEVHVMHTIPEEHLPMYTGACPHEVQWRPLIPYTKSRLVDFLSSTLGYAHMYWANTVSMQRALSRPLSGRLRSKLMVRAERKLGRLAAAMGAVDAVDRVQAGVARKAPETAAYIRMFRELQPEVIFSTNQRPSEVLPAILAAKELGIPTATFIFSWDNLSSKARIAAPFDYFLVWSEHMRQELLRFYPHVPPSHVEIVGTPQFDPYDDPSLIWSRERFFAEVGADPSRPLICYSGGDTRTCPEDPLHVAELMKLIRAGRIEGNPTVLVRPVPVDDGTRYRQTLQQFPEILFRQPKWIHADTHWAGVIPTAEDLEFLANVTHHADMNINLGSTMTLDFGLHDKPVVNVAFDCTDPPLFGMPVYDYYYAYEHFQPVVEFGASRIARNRDQLAGYVNDYLRDPGLDREGRAKLARLHVKMPLGQAGSRISDALVRIAKPVKR